MAKVVIYTKSHCPYCVRAKNLLSQKGVQFEELFMDDKPDVYAQLKARTGMMTVPQIFINDELVGGFSELSGLDLAGKLDSMLK